ncbi:MAG: O-antigen ligase family protein [Lachnospiraceae bacterium]
MKKAAAFLIEKYNVISDKAPWIRQVILMGIFGLMIYSGMKFMNAGDSYGQAIYFRMFCILTGFLVLGLMEFRQWVSVWTFLYLPVCYFATHVAYERHWIADICEYQFVDVIRLGKMVILVWGIVLIAILRDLIKNRRVALVKFNSLLGGLWFLFIILLTLFKKEYFYAVFFVVCMTSFYWVLVQNKRQKIVWKALQDAMILSFFYVAYKMLMHRPYDCERYTLYFVNANHAGMYLACLISCIFVRIDAWWEKARRQKKYIAGLVFAYLLMGYACSLAIFNYTRTTLMGIGFAFLVLFVLQLVKAPKKLAVLAEYVLILVSVITMFQATYLTIRYIPAYVNEPFLFAGEYNPETRIMKDDPVDSPKYTTMESFLTLALGKWGIYVDFSEENQEAEKEVVIDSERDVTNGRVEIWNTYFSRLNWTGHYPGHIIMEDEMLCYHAHNTYLHILYQYGIPTGIVYILLVVCSFVTAVINFWKRARQEASHDLMLAVLITGICLVGQITEWMGHPAYIICMMLFMMYGMLLCDTPEKKQVETSEKKMQQEVINER